MYKKIIGIAAAVLGILLAAAGCGKGSKGPKGPEPALQGSGSLLQEGELMDFQKIRIAENSMMAYSTVYYAERTEDGVHLEYYLGGYDWDAESGEEKELKQMIRQFDGDEALYQSIAALAGSCELEKWNGFSGSDPDVLDGYSFTMNAVLADGTEISASGSNSFPDGYHGFISAIDGFLTRAEVASKEFDGGDYTATLPESWIGNMTAIFRDGYVAFEVQTTEQNRTLFCIYDEPYEYGDGFPEYKTVTTYKKDGQTWYIVISRMPESYSAYDEMSDVQKAICDQLDADMEKISAGIRIKK